MMAQTFLGVDVAKDWLDISDRNGRAERIDNTPEAVQAFAVRSAETAVRIVFEATGGYDRLLAEALAAAGVSFSRVNPRRARDFARAMGVIGKTDRVDARVLAEFGEVMQPAASQLPDATRRTLQAYLARRRQLVEIRKQEKTRRQQIGDALVRADIEDHISCLGRRITRLEALIQELVRADPALAEIEQRLRTAPGVGLIVALTLIAELPELGQLDRRAIAALAGLAPVARDSGKRQAARTIWGGRPVVRALLYVAALQASRRDPTFKAFRTRLQGAGKPLRAALVATARKLVTVLNAMLAKAADYRADPAQTTVETPA